MREFKPLTKENADAYLKTYVHVLNKTSNEPRHVRETVKKIVEAEIISGKIIKLHEDTVYLIDGENMIPKCKLIQ